MPQKGRCEHERKANEADKCCILSEISTKDSLVEAVFNEIKLSLQQNHRAFTT